jgi:formylglycine-generating enzyme required for sulfatase activity
MKLNVCVISFLFFIFNAAFAQNISNITATQSGKNIVINYHLNGQLGIKFYEIQLYVSPDGGSTWQGPLTAVSGAVGKWQVAGFDKSITWAVLTEPVFSQLIGENIQFKIKASYQDKDDIKMVWVEGGSFMMGSNEGEEDEKPIHKVTLKGFYMGKYEVTQEQWQKVMGNNPSKFSGCPKCPVEQVSWDEIQVFIKKLNTQTGKSYRLPTEAEWEYAAKGGNNYSSYKYSGSDSIDEVAWYANNFGNINQPTHPIGSKNANVLGLYDMSGNVWEWCSDWYDETYYQYSIKSNPEGGLNGNRRVVRGGSWSGGTDNCRLAYRSSFEPNDSHFILGFRLACSVDE